MEEWLELDIPKLGYILEFSFPQNDRMLVRTPDGMFSIDLQDEPARVDHVMSTEEVEVLDNGDSWGTEYSETLNFDDEEWFFLGSETTVELMTTISTGVRIEISNDRKHIMLINTANQKTIQKIEFIPATEEDDFSIAGFSLDEKYLILCTNDLLRVFVRDELD
ncbi:hypothetical protein KA183_16420 [bacterium]|nr:hypothetical protein [bacterium]QQR59422.1 MAG: hypothetical protein IPG59_08010 [Candidatus Melainabacteria bacterium]